MLLREHRVTGGARATGHRTVGGRAGHGTVGSTLSRAGGEMRDFGSWGEVGVEERRVAVLLVPELIEGRSYSLVLGQTEPAAELPLDVRAVFLERIGVSARAFGSQHDQDAPSISRDALARDEPGVRQPVDQARHSAGREQRLFLQFLHAQSLLRRVKQAPQCIHHRERDS